VPPAKAADMQRDLSRIGCGATRIGRVVSGERVRMLDHDGGELVIERAGWNHFA